MLCSHLAFAQTAENRGAGTAEKTKIFSSISLSYISWTELVDLSNGAATDRAYANFYGNSFIYEREVYHSLRSGFTTEFGLMYGQAGAGGTQSLLTYQTANQKFFGAEFSGRYAYRLSPQILIGFGPLVLYRNIKWPSDATVDAKSGSDVNLGLVTELKMRLSQDWDLRQTFGTLAFKASTLWTLGVGYKY